MITLKRFETKESPIEFRKILRRISNERNIGILSIDQAYDSYDVVFEAFEGEDLFNLLDEICGLCNARILV
jgi:hypothetical protein